MADNYKLEKLRRKVEEIEKQNSRRRSDEQFENVKPFITVMSVAAGVAIARWLSRKQPSALKVLAVFIIIYLIAALVDKGLGFTYPDENKMYKVYDEATGITHKVKGTYYLGMMEDQEKDRLMREEGLTRREAEERLWKTVNEKFFPRKVYKGKVDDFNKRMKKYEYLVRYKEKIKNEKR